jgi:hypothetical protein
MKVKIKFGKGYIKTHTVYSVGVRNHKLLCLWNTFWSCMLLCTTILIAVTIYILEYSLDFTCHKAGKLRYTSINPHMNSLAVDLLAMVTEPQLNSYCAILTLNGAIKIDAVAYCWHSPAWLFLA